MASETDQLIDRIRKAGYRIEKTGNGHYGILDPEGEVVRMPSGQPYKFAATPSDSHAVRNTVAELRRLGVLPKSPKVPRQRQLLMDRSDKLRGEVTKLMKDHDLRQSDIYNFADKWAAEHGIAVPSHGAGIMGKFLKGAYLTDANYQWLSQAISAIRRAGGIIPSMEHPGRREQPQPEQEIQVETEDPEYEPPTKLPRLALDVMQTIYKEEKDHDAIMALVEEVARLELGQ